MSSVRPLFRIVCFALAAGAITSVRPAPPPAPPHAPAERERMLLEQAHWWQEASRPSAPPAAARAAAERALAGERALFGPTTPAAVFLLSWLARQYGTERTPSGRAKAERYRDEAVAIQRRLLGRQPGRAEVEGRPLRTEAERYRQAVAVREKVLGKGNWLVRVSLVGQALALEAGGDIKEAQTVLQEAAKRLKAARGPQERENLLLGPWTDAHFHVHRLRLRADLHEGELRERPPAEITQSLHKALEQAGEAERQEARTDLVPLPGGKGSPPGGPREIVREALWRKALLTARKVLQDSAPCSVRVRLDLAVEVRPVFDRYLSFARRTGVSAAGAYNEIFAQLKGSVFIQQRRIWLERRHPALRPLFDELEKVNEALAESGAERLELLICKSALEAELGRRWAGLPVMQLQPPSGQLPPEAVLVDYVIYQRPPVASKGGLPPRPASRLACFISHSKYRKGKPAVTYLDLGSLAPISEALTAWRLDIERGRGAPTQDPSAPQAVLRQRVWEPLKAELAGAEVVLIAPDGPLCALPFAALPGSRPNTYLIEETRLAVAPTPWLLTPLPSMTEMLARQGSPLFASAPRKDLAKGPLLVGDVEFGRGTGKLVFDPLPGTAREIAKIGDLFDSLHARSLWRPEADRLSGDRATVAAVREAVGQHRWAHLATHGYWMPGEGRQPELRSALVLAGPGRKSKKTGILTAFEVSGLDLERTDLVVLSACETALGKVQEGQGVLGLQRAFQVAGARSVVASLWQVPDEATQFLMERFYANLWQRRLNRLEALREAQLWMIREGGRQPGVARGMVRRDRKVEPAPGGKLVPLGWAAFVLSGDWKTPGDESMVTLFEANFCFAFSPDGKKLAAGAREIHFRDVRTGKTAATLSGHTDPVRSVAFSPDGKTLASGGDESIKLWDVSTRRNTATLAGGSGPVAFGPDGKLLVSGSNGNSISLWDARTGRAVLTKLTAPVQTVLFSPDGKALAADEHNGHRIFLWDIASDKQIAILSEYPRGFIRIASFSPDGRTLASIDSHNSHIQLWDVASGKAGALLFGRGPLAFSPDGKTLALGGADFGIKLWDVASGKGLAVLPGDGVPIKSVSFAPDGKTLVSEGALNIRLWSVAGKSIATLGEAVSPVCFSPNGTVLVSGSGSNAIKFWDARSGKNTASLAGHGRSVRSLSFSPDGKTLVSEDVFDVLLWDVASGKSLAVLEGARGPASFAPGGKTLASGGKDNAIRLWDVRSRKNIGNLKGNAAPVWSIAFPSDGKALAAEDALGIGLWDVVAGKRIATLAGAVGPVAFSPDGKLLLARHAGNNLRLWDVKRGALTAILAGAASPVGPRADGKTLASVGQVHSIKLRDIATGNDRVTCLGHTGSVLSVAVSPDGKTLASGSADRSIKLWDAQTGKNTATLWGHAHSVRSVVFSPDGKALASEDGAIVQLWDVASGTNNATLWGHTDTIQSLAFSPDSKTLVSEDGKGIKLWEVKTGKIVLTLATAAGPVAYSPDARTLASGLNGKSIRLWDVASRKNTGNLAVRAAPVRALAFGPVGKVLAAEDALGTQLWDVVRGKSMATLAGDGPVAFSPDGRTVALPDRFTHALQLWDVASGKNTATLTGHSHAVRSLSFSPDGAAMVSRTDGESILWDVVRGNDRGTLRQTDRIQCSAFSPDGKALALGLVEDAIEVWNVASGKKTATHTGHGQPLRFSPDGNTLVSRVGKTTKLWDLTTGKSTATFPVAFGPVALSADGKTLATGGGRNVTLWDVATGRNTITLTGHTRTVTSIAFGPDGKVLATGDETEIKLWDLTVRATPGP